MKAEKITDRCVRFSLRPLGSYDLYSHLIIGEHNLYLIDTGSGSLDAEDIVRYLQENHLNKPLIIINTHYHWDHIWGNAYIPSKSIVASQKCKEIIERKWVDMLKNNQRFLCGETTMCLPTITFDETYSFPEDNLFLFKSIGHSPDGICIYDSIDKVLYVGDNIGDNDAEIVPQLEDTQDEYLEALNKMKQFDFRFLLSGHNNVQTKEYLDLIIEELTKSL